MKNEYRSENKLFIGDLCDRPYTVVIYLIFFPESVSEILYNINDTDIRRVLGTAKSVAKMFMFFSP